jgi:hypothetical protein
MPIERAMAETAVMAPANRPRPLPGAVYVADRKSSSAMASLKNTNVSWLLFNYLLSFIA